MHHFVRIGFYSQVGRFQSTDGARYTRGDRVIVRSRRGLEVGEVTGEAAAAESTPDGAILRGMTPEDHLLVTRLDQRRAEAYEACVKLLVDRGILAALMDVELLFDGQRLYFHFLGDPPTEVEELMDELTQTYETQAQIGRFAETLTVGCGPGCGTDEAMGQGGCESCVSCAVASACKK